LSHLRRLDLEAHLVASDTAEQVCAFEGHPLPKAWEPSAGLPARLVRHRPADLFAAPASGSFRHLGMVVLPCSAGTVGRLAAGTSDSLLLRAADVCLKERRPLVIVVRETPLSRIHLRNLLELSDAGAVILPANPGFYQKPSSIEELVDGLLDRVFDQLGLPMELSPRWKDQV
jgi:4-hydroxy-3-polyprenylbenzoate decarboxylase